MKRIFEKISSSEILVSVPITILLLLAWITWLGRFAKTNEFGLYYEDWGRIPIGMAWTWPNWLEYLAQVPGWLISFQYEGRALHPASIHSFAFLGQQLGGLSVIYFLGCCVAVLNTLLYYFLLKRSTKNFSFALFGGLAFALFPTHTSQALLTITFGILPSLTLLLIALHLYLNQTKFSIIASYLVIFISMFWYEKFLLPFCAAPLLKPDYNPKDWKEGIRHCGIVIAILGLVAIGRKLSGEGRVAELQATSFLLPLQSLVVGPIMTLNTFFERPVRALASISIEELLPLGLAFLAIAYAIYQTLTISSKSDSILHPNSSSIGSDDAVSKLPLKKLAIAGLLMLILAYPLTFRDSPYIIEGRTSHVHVAAVVGGSLLWACFCSFICSLRIFESRKTIATVLFSVYFTLLIAFGFTVQQDYVIAAQYQRSFWTQLVKLCPDMTEGTVILNKLSVSRDFDTLEPISPLHTGHFSRIPGYFYKFPEPWLQKGEVWTINFMQSRQPKIYNLQPKWQTRILSNQDGLFHLDQKVVTPKKLAGITVNSPNVILISSQDGQLVRQTEPLVLDGKSFPLKQPDPNLRWPPFEKGLLHDKFIDSDNEG